ncbi:MAG TPA: hypothetical protein VNR61_19495 [Niallia sp.]|nr:hypothetical protein [Niallia sp.]
MKRLIASILSLFLFSTLFSLLSYTPSSQREANVYYFGFLETFIFVIIYAGPVYLIAGIPLSLFIDQIIEKFNSKSKWKKYLIGLSLYSLIGILVGVIFLILLSQNSAIYFQVILTYSLYGFFASTIYYHLLILVSCFNRK